MNDDNQLDPRGLALDELRALRNRLQAEDDSVSYVRRVAQARLDLVRSERARRAEGRDPVDVESELREVLASHLSAGPATRAPRQVDEIADHPLVDELEALCIEHRCGQLPELSAEEIDTLEGELSAFEQRVSADRRARYSQLDALSAELVRRYREGEATVDDWSD